MKLILLRQVQYIPLPVMLLTMIVALLVPGYSSRTQHISELGIMAHPLASVMPIAVLIAGASIVLFGLGLWRHPSKAFRYTAVTMAIFGVSFMSAGIWPTGSAKHGLYGLTMFYVVVPACFAAELPSRYRSNRTVALSLAASCLPLLYMWALLGGLEPQGVRGVTQRLAMLVIFGWYPYAASVLLRDASPDAPSAAGVPVPQAV